MNLDLLKKLTRLANNNPNDNEANLAARRVCKMLAECDFKLVETVQSRPNTSSMGTPPRPPEPKKEQKEHPWTYKPSKSQEDYIRDIFGNFNFGRKFYGGQWSGKAEQQQNSNRYDIPYDPYFNPRRKDEPKEKRELNCTRCGRPILTAYIGNIFVCNDCHWKEYNERRGT